MLTFIVPEKVIVEGNIEVRADRFQDRLRIYNELLVGHRKNREAFVTISEKGIRLILPIQRGQADEPSITSFDGVQLR